MARIVAFDPALYASAAAYAEQLPARTYGPASMHLAPLKLVVADYLAEKKARRQANTTYGYESSINLHVLPRWKASAITEITRDAIQEWVDSMVPTAGPGGAWKAYKCLRQVIRWAIKKWSLQVIDPTVGVEEPRKPIYKFDSLTVRRLKRLIRGMVGCEFEPTAVIQVALGLRPGENYHLHWQDINWRTGMVPIRGTLQQVAGRVVEQPPKTAKSERDPYLPPWALDRLHQIWVERGRPKGRVIGDAKPSRIYRVLKRWATANRLPWVGMKNLRHTWATIAVASGVAIEVVASMMGHSNIQTCYRYYMALTAAAMRRAQKCVARSIMGKTVDDMYKGITLTSAPRTAPQELPMAA